MRTAVTRLPITRDTDLLSKEVKTPILKYDKYLSYSEDYVGKLAI